MSDAQEINKLRNEVGALQHDLDVARTELQLLRQLNLRLQEAQLTTIPPVATKRCCPRCGCENIQGDRCLGCSTYVP